MSIQECAAAALHFPNRTVTTPDGMLPLGLFMLSVGGAESSWNETAEGDYGLPGPSCNGYTSWGWLQIHSVHAGLLTSLSGSSDPCVWAQWLYNPVNTVAAAMGLLGLRSTYLWQQIVGPYAPWAADENKWQEYLPAAQNAWDAALKQTATKAPTAPLSPSARGTLVFAVGVAAGAAAFMLAERRRHPWKKTA